MATNFLIALACGLGSAALIIFVVRVLVTIFAPKSLKERIQETKAPFQHSGPGRVEISNPSVASFSQEVSGKNTGIRQVYFDSVTLTGTGGIEVAALLNTSGQSSQARQFGFISRISRDEIQKRQPQKEAISLEAVLSPPGQSRAQYGTETVHKSNSGVANEAFCGSAG
jgi:hypothetical protein